MHKRARTLTEMRPGDSAIATYWLFSVSELQIREIRDLKIATGSSSIFRRRRGAGSFEDVPGGGQHILCCLNGKFINSSNPRRISRSDSTPRVLDSTISCVFPTLCIAYRVLKTIYRLSFNDLSLRIHLVGGLPRMRPVFRIRDTPFCIHHRKGGPPQRQLETSRGACVSHLTSDSTGSGYVLSPDVSAISTPIIIKMYAA